MTIITDLYYNDPLISIVICVGWIYVLCFISDILHIRWSKRLAVSVALLGLVVGVPISFGALMGEEPLVILVYGLLLSIILAILFLFDKFRNFPRIKTVKFLLLIPAFLLLSLNLSLFNLNVLVCQFSGPLNIMNTVLPYHAVHTQNDQPYDTRNRCFSMVAITNEDEVKCDSIRPASFRETKVCRSDEHNPSWPPECFYIINEKEACYLEVAKKKNEVSVCERMPLDTNNDLCYEKMANELKDINICLRIMDVHSKDRCYQDIAIDKNDPSICSLIKYKNDWCYTRVAEVRQDATLCENVYVGQKDDCYRVVAPFIKDEKICDFIKSEEKKQRCLNDVYWVTHR